MKRIFVLLLILSLLAPSTVTAGTIPPPSAPIQRIMFVGNSLTLHTPYPAVGWHGYWGMAASQPDKDYVHRVQLGVTAKQGSIVEIAIVRADIPFPDANIATKIQAFQPDIIVVQMGNNALPTVPLDVWRTQYQAIAQASSARLIVVGLWGIVAGDVREDYVKTIATEIGAQFVSIEDLYSAETTADAATFADVGVQWHPGDAGMQMIADRIVAAIYGEVVWLPVVGN